MSLLPSAKTPPNVTLANQTVLLWGPAKVGKSEFCSKAEPALFLATEAGLNHLNVFQTPIASWDDFLSACKEISDGEHSFLTIVIDTIDNAYRMCTEYICKLHNIKHESDLGFGKGYALVNGEFSRVLTKLSMLPYGLYLVSHAQDIVVESRTGNYTKVVPTLPDKSRKLVLGMCDLILYVDFVDVINPDGSVAQNRVLRTKPTKYYEVRKQHPLRPPVVVSRNRQPVMQRFPKMPVNRSKLLSIIVDTREQQPFEFDPAKVETIRQALTAGDYSLAGFEPSVSVERKSLEEYISSVIKSQSSLPCRINALW